ncbi:hypothetical protein JG688_00009494 [Phytophthora aleatoria]|uniref:Uncharacterized protein n=1 Tax=Phytophthora aleatoria TaxID=2496075 RepID=A0A8J5IGA7_9STRA|nr:hypothetical protein JG688_00009494 [Phytophthora aleatoria]
MLDFGTCASKYAVKCYHFFIRSNIDDSRKLNECYWIKDPLTEDFCNANKLHTRLFLAVVDLRVRRSSSWSSSDGSTQDSGADQAESDLEEEQPSDYGGEFGCIYADREDALNTAGPDESSSHESTTVEPSTLRERNVRQGFCPEEDYLLVVQANVDAPYTAKQGEVNKQ